MDMSQYKAPSSLQRTRPREHRRHRSTCLCGSAAGCHRRCCATAACGGVPFQTPPAVGQPSGGAAGVRPHADEQQQHDAAVAAAGVANLLLPSTGKWRLSAAANPRPSMRHMMRQLLSSSRGNVNFSREWKKVYRRGNAYSRKRRSQTTAVIPTAPHRTGETEEGRRADRDRPRGCPAAGWVARGREDAEPTARGE